MTQPSTPPRYDKGMFEKARAGDNKALESLIIATQPDIRRYAKRNCSAADIDDAVQETLWLLAKRIGTVKMLTSLPAWLFTVVRRECLRIAQRTKGDSIVNKAENIDEYQDDVLLSNKPTDALRIDLIRAIQALPEHYRHVVLLRDMEGMSIEEIADKLQRSRESIKAQLYRARLLIREYLI
ncbi:RNA polymerase sigma factor [Pseudoalteromonas sp. OOF1S-7]|uniref:RNA polymerase sigma factor n=1 Tax=Pseudoalteromonas sp. OOF1S-7 TaxID=2917757 RepID=UPI001EF42FA7|nr:RNA polymerase sigma factor [Pseudoalteromonas sp. OOF1S-7]MCG7534524.1 RNA polymerase sigma factor [Pseudoalteromonas sp. OOF1S-7]